MLMRGSSLRPWTAGPETVTPDDSLFVAVFDDSATADTPRGRAVDRIIRGIEESGIRVAGVATPGGARAALSVLPEADGILIGGNAGGAMELVREIRSRNEEIPVFLMAGPEGVAPAGPDIGMIGEISEYIDITEDTPEFIAGRIAAAAKRYRERLLPPFFGGLVRFSKDFEYSWHTPGHAGGTAFRKSPSGRIFASFFGEQLFRSDLSVSVRELGSLLDHAGPAGEAEQYAAKVFGADRTYFVTNGTSTANRIVCSARVTNGDVVVVDRNCHKSVEHALTLTGSVAVYLFPTRNRYGIIGPIPPGEMTGAAVAAKLAACPLTRDLPRKAVHAIITNSTYDGLCYDARDVEELLGESVDSIHFDEAWYAYARFNSLYRDRFAMRDGARASRGPTVFATQSTHKLLAALSQASMIHIRHGRAPVEHSRFNEAFMMHSSTSPLYPVIASLDVSSKMMEGASGRQLTSESIEEAIRFRKTMARAGRGTGAGKAGAGWGFAMWQPERVTDPATGKEIEFADAPVETLRDNPSCWVLHPDERWHGFYGLPDNYCMLDPIKVTVLMPGVNDDGTPAPWGIPAAVVAKFLDTRGIICEKSGDYTILFLFSIGITRGKWGTLVTELFEFKRLYDENAPLAEVFPDLTGAVPERYGSMTLQDLADGMHAFRREHRLGELLHEAFSIQPEPAITYAETYRKLVRGEVERVPVAGARNRIAATGIIPYPPGIPLLAPGERTGREEGPVLRYLMALQEFDRRFPGFGHEIHGITDAGGEFLMNCIRED